MVVAHSQICCSWTLATASTTRRVPSLTRRHASAPLFRSSCTSLLRSPFWFPLCGQPWSLIHHRKKGNIIRSSSRNCFRPELHNGHAAGFLNYSDSFPSPCMPCVVRSRSRWDYVSDDEELPRGQRGGKKFDDYGNAPYDAKENLFSESVSSFTEVLQQFSWVVFVVPVALAIVAFGGAWLLVTITIIFAITAFTLGKTTFGPSLIDLWRSVLQFSSTPIYESSDDRDFSERPRQESNPIRSSQAKPSQIYVSSTPRRVYEDSDDFFASGGSEPYTDMRRRGLDRRNAESETEFEVRDEATYSQPKMLPSDTASAYPPAEKTKPGPYYARMWVPKPRARGVRPGSGRKNVTSDSSRTETLGGGSGKVPSESVGSLREPASYSSNVPGKYSRDLPFFLRLLLAIFPFLRSWGGFL